MGYCCVPFCKSSSKNKAVLGLSFHEFPSNLQLRSRWLLAIARKDFVINDKSCSSIVCSKHFKESDYTPDIKIRRLKPNVVPSVFSYHIQHRKDLFQNEFKQPQICKVYKVADSIDRSKKLSLLENKTKVNDEDMIQLDNLIGDDCDHSYAHVENHNISKQEPFSKIVEMSPIRKKSMEIRRLQSLLYKRNKKISLLKDKVDEVSKELQNYENNIYISNIMKMQALDRDGLGNNSVSISFLLAQVKNFGNKTPRWPKSVIRECANLNSTSATAYRTLYSRNLIKLPSPKTLRRSVTGGAKVTSLLRERLEKGNTKLAEN